MTAEGSDRDAAPSRSDPLDALRRDPGRGVVLTDFDGTLAALVDDPAAATAAPGALEALVALSGRYALVGVVSGRPVGFLRRQLAGRDPATSGGVDTGRVWLSGLYGLETFEGGRTVELDGAAVWRPVVEAATARATARFGSAAEGKGLSLTLHFRGRPDLEPAICSWAEEEASSSGLLLRPAKASVELHPPLGLDKGSVVQGAVAAVNADVDAGVGAVCFMGDDVGDLPAFDALDRLAAQGVAVVRVAAATPDTPEELRARADLVVEGPGAAVALLRSL